MRMNKQTRAFAKQVQVDLLALCDTDLFQTLHLRGMPAPLSSLLSRLRCHGTNREGGLRYVETFLTSTT